MLSQNSSHGKKNHPFFRFFSNYFRRLRILDNLHDRNRARNINSNARFSVSPQTLKNPIIREEIEFANSTLENQNSGQNPDQKVDENSISSQEEEKFVESENQPHVKTHVSTEVDKLDIISRKELNNQRMEKLNNFLAGKDQSSKPKSKKDNKKDHKSKV
jgi:hypothetical protein